LHLQLQLAAGAGLDHIARRQVAAHRQHDSVRQGRLVSALDIALLTLVALPQLPFTLPFAIGLVGMHRQHGIGAVALGGLSQRGRISAFELLGIGHQLLLQIGQRQPQRQAAVLGCPAQRLGTGLAVADQVAAFGTVVEPPAEDGGPVTAPQRQPGLAQGPFGAAGVELDQHRFWRPGLGTDLVDDLLRVLAQRGQRRALHRLGVAGQAQHQGIEGLASGGAARFGALPFERLAHLIEPGDSFSLRSDAGQCKAPCCQIIE